MEQPQGLGIAGLVRFGQATFHRGDRASERAGIIGGAGVADVAGLALERPLGKLVHR